MCGNKKIIISLGRKIKYQIYKTQNKIVKTMENNFEKVKNYLLDLEYSITVADEASGTLVINKEDEGIKNMVLVCADPILIMEQPLFTIKNDDVNVFKILLAQNRQIVHGAFAIDETDTVLFRDTLQLESLDLNEIEGSLNSLSMLLSEFGNKILEFSK